MKAPTTFEPSLTIVVTTGYGVEAARMTLASIAAQTIAKDIELFLCVNPGTDVTAARPFLESVGRFRLFDTEAIDTTDYASARMTLEANAPYVAMIEDHAFLDPDWAERLVATFEATGADAIGSGMINANPHSQLSWGNFMLAYAHWSVTTPEGPINWVSHHNGAFRVSTLGKLTPDEVVYGCNREGQIVQDLKQRGAVLHFQPACQVRHVNPSSVSSSYLCRADAGRLYAANRVTQEGWGPAKRAAYVALAPAIPPLRYLRMRKNIFKQLPGTRERTHWRGLITALVFDAVGQALGYLAGEGGARKRLANFEMNRAQHLNDADRARLYPDGPQPVRE